MSDIILKMSNIDKYFAGVCALNACQFELRAGEVHALMGENGAGKSTLMKVLCGIYQRDGGTVNLFGKDVNFNSIAESQAAGVGMIHQELNMMNHLTVAQNVFIGREPLKKGGYIDDKKMESDCAKLFERIGVHIDPSTILGTLTVGKQQMVEIAKAISRESQLLILDEPTATLTQPEVEELFHIMQDFKGKGIGMIYISHRMDEITRISDRVSVMRDGEYIGTLQTKDTCKDEIVKMMVGRVILGDKKTTSNVPQDAEVVLSVKHLSRGRQIKDVSFDLRRGEILGFSGLMGAGRTEVARAIFGADPFESGEIWIHGKKVEMKIPEQAVENGVCYLSEDRKRYGCLLNKSVAANSALSSLLKYVKHGVIDDHAIEQEATAVNQLLNTKTPSVRQLVKNLSGGNQQKVIIAKWLIRDSDIFIFDEPTRGIDIGAKSEIYALMEDLVSKGKSIIMISSELAEIQRLSDRVVVMCEGAITAILGIDEVSQETVMKYATMREG